MFGGLALALAWLCVAAPTLAPTAQAAPPAPLDQRFMVDPLTGFALSGYDPMTYFLLDAPLQGVKDHETRWAGVAWRFANAANKAAFLDAPEIYAPRFGGFDVVEMARGRLVESNPEIFVLRQDRVYLFSTEVRRTVFLEQPGHFVARAAETWPTLRRTAPLAITVGYH